MVPYYSPCSLIMQEDGEEKGERGEERGKREEEGVRRKRGKRGEGGGGWYSTI